MTTRSPRTPAALLIAAVIATMLVASAATAPTAAAAVIASTTSSFQGGPAFASDGRIVVGERRGAGAVRILAIDPKTRSVTRLTSLPRLADPKTSRELSVSGGGGATTLSLATYREFTGIQVGPEDLPPTLQESRALTLLPSIAPLASCGRPSRLFRTVQAAAGSGFIATIGEECAQTRPAVRIRTATGTLTIPATTSAEYRLSAPTIVGLQASGALLSWIEAEMLSDGGSAHRLLVVAHGPTGRVLLRVPVDSYVQTALGPDGTVAFITSLPFCNLGVLSLTSPAPRALRPPGALCPGTRPLAVAGGRIVYSGLNGYAVSDLQGAARPLAETGPHEGGAPIAFDGRTVVIVRPDCDAERLIAVDVDAAAGPIVQQPIAQDTCPVRRSGSARLRVAPDDGRVRIRLRCSAGCRGTLRLVQQRRGRRERLVASASYRGGPGSVLVRPRIARYARALAGCSGGLRVTAKRFPGGRSTYENRQRGLGSYRITSRTSCLRTGGPAFAAPRAGPRP